MPALYFCVFNYVFVFLVHTIDDSVEPKRNNGGSKMKQFFAILLCLVMVCALVACNNSTPNNGNNDNNGTNGTNGTNDITGTRPITVVQSMELRTA